MRRPGRRGLVGGESRGDGASPEHSRTTRRSPAGRFSGRGSVWALDRVSGRGPQGGSDGAPPERPRRSGPTPGRRAKPIAGADRSQFPAPSEANPRRRAKPIRGAERTVMTLGRVAPPHESPGRCLYACRGRAGSFRGTQSPAPTEANSRDFSLNPTGPWLQLTSVEGVALVPTLRVGTALPPLRGVRSGRAAERPKRHPDAERRNEELSASARSLQFLAPSEANSARRAKPIPRAERSQFPAPSEANSARRAKPGVRLWFAAVRLRAGRGRDVRPRTARVLIVKEHPISS